MAYIGTKDVSMNGQIDYENGVRIPDTSSFKTAQPNSVFLCIEGGNAGKKIALTRQEVCFGNKLCCFSPILINSEFIYYYINSDDFSVIFRSNVNGIIGGVSVNKLKTLELPIPPLAEQKRISDTIKAQFQILDEITSNIVN
jgi:type I restriction enzyme S subunit